MEGGGIDPETGTSFSGAGSAGSQKRVRAAFHAAVAEVDSS